MDALQWTEVNLGKVGGDQVAIQVQLFQELHLQESGWDRADDLVVTEDDAFQERHHGERFRECAIDVVVFHVDGNHDAHVGANPSLQVSATFFGGVRAFHTGPRTLVLAEPVGLVEPFVVGMEPKRKQREALLESDAILRSVWFDGQGILLRDPLQRQRLGRLRVRECCGPAGSKLLHESLQRSSAGDFLLRVRIFEVGVVSRRRGCGIVLFVGRLRSHIQLASWTSRRCLHVRRLLLAECARAESDAEDESHDAQTKPGEDQVAAAAAAAAGFVRLVVGGIVLVGGGRCRDDLHAAAVINVHFDAQLVVLVGASAVVEFRHSLEDLELLFVRWDGRRRRRQFHRRFVALVVEVCHGWMLACLLLACRRLIDLLLINCAPSQ
mmetsp:Transcript_22979/g.65117  ORF Transcript_22979/g.65117 Transcript_22979/m.65117 type:complete len:382 (+) Transcript_22979:1852-2997(+)